MSKVALYALLGLLVLGLGALLGILVADEMWDNDGSEQTTGSNLSNAELREVSTKICGHEYIQDGGWEDDDGDGYGWLVNDPEQNVLPYDEAVVRSIDYCREYGLAHVSDGDLDGIHDYIDPQTCFPGLPDEGPPPSGAPYCAELAQAPE